MAFRFTLSRGMVKGIVDAGVKGALITTGESLVVKIRNSMNPGMYRKYKFKGGTHYSSMPGTPPAPWTRRLSDSITYATSFGSKSSPGPSARATDGINSPIGDDTEMVLSVGSNVEYALSMERGLKSKKVSPRPYLWPALSGSRELIKKSFVRV